MYSIIFAKEIKVDKYKFYLYRRKCTKKHKYAHYKMHGRNNIKLLLKLEVDHNSEITRSVLLLKINNVKFKIQKEKNNR